MSCRECFGTIDKSLSAPILIDRSSLVLINYSVHSSDSREAKYWITLIRKRLITITMATLIIFNFISIFCASTSTYAPILVLSQVGVLLTKLLWTVKYSGRKCIYTIGHLYKNPQTKFLINISKPFFFPIVIFCGCIKSILSGVKATTLSNLLHFLVKEMVVCASYSFIFSNVMKSQSNLVICGLNFQVLSTILNGSGFYFWNKPLFWTCLSFSLLMKVGEKTAKVVIINNLFKDAVSVVSIATGVVCAYVMGEHAQRPYWVLAAQDWHTFAPCLSPSAVRDRGEALLICHKQSNRGSQRWRPEEK